VAASHSCAVPSSEAVTMRPPSGEKAAEGPVPPWPSNRCVRRMLAWAAARRALANA
jgi:hypothetical protein